MIKLHDNVPATTSGKIRAFFIDRDGNRTPLADRSNVVAYTAADLMARVLAGDDSYLPRHVGFIYGTEYSPLLDDPDALPLETRRVHDWPRIASDVAAIGGNMAVAPLIQAPTVGIDGSATLYSANAMTVSAHTGLTSEYAFSTSGSTYAQGLDVLGSTPGQDIYFYHAVLLNRWESGGKIVYTPFSRAAIGSAPFEPKPPRHELCVFWTITFK